MGRASGIGAGTHIVVTKTATNTVAKAAPQAERGWPKPCHKVDHQLAGGFLGAAVGKALRAAARIV
jgi:hypothetical protein